MRAQRKFHLLHNSSKSEPHLSPTKLSFLSGDYKWILWIFSPDTGKHAFFYTIFAHFIDWQWDFRPSRKFHQNNKKIHKILAFDLILFTANSDQTVYYSSKRIYLRHALECASLVVRWRDVYAWTLSNQYHIFDPTSVKSLYRPLIKKYVYLYLNLSVSISS